MSLCINLDNIESIFCFKIIKQNMEILITTKQLDHVWSHDKILYNTNNHYVDEKIPQPEDYHIMSGKCHTKNWIDKFHTNYHKIIIPKEEISWMYKASKIGMITRKFSKLYEDELDELYNNYQNQFPEGRWFIRSEKVSLKEGQHGVGPYTDFRSMIESSVSSGCGHTVFNKDDENITFYLFPWIDINPDKEFRIFVYNNNITAISAQHLYSINDWLVKLSNDQIKQVVNKIITYFNDNIRNKLEYIESYTMDLALVGSNNEPYFIEPNSFGKYYAAGSALYSWIYDHDTLHDSSFIEIRYCNEY